MLCLGKSADVFCQGILPCGHVIDVNDPQDKVIQNGVVGTDGGKAGLAGFHCFYGGRISSQAENFPGKFQAAAGAVAGGMIGAVFIGGDQIAD